MSRQRSGGPKPPGHGSRGVSPPGTTPPPERRPALTLVAPAGPAHGPELAVLTNRIAATLVHHDPGWRLPRPTVLARHYDVTTELVEAAVDHLEARRLIRRLPDGQACRTSPAHYVLPLRRAQSLDARAEAVSSDLALKSKTLSWHPVKDDIRRALRASAGEPVCAIQLVWTIAAEPAAATMTYATKALVDPIIDAVEHTALDPIGAVLPLPGQGECGSSQPALLVPRTLHIEVQQPPPWATRALGLSACEHAVVVTAGCEEQPDGRNVALTVAAFLPEAFRISIASSDPPLDGTGRRGWADLAADWDA